MIECASCKTTEKIQYHHISYEPEETIPLCIQCHFKIHKHGVGIAQNDRVSFTQEKQRFIEAWNQGIIYRKLMIMFNISFATVNNWRKICKLEGREGSRKIDRDEEENTTTYEELVALQKDKPSIDFVSNFEPMPQKEEK